MCAKLIPATELVMKVLGKVYHLQCFTCTTCHNQLVSGDRFHVVNGRLFCENDDPNLLKQIHAAKQTVSSGKAGIKRLSKWAIYYSSEVIISI